MSEKKIQDYLHLYLGCEVMTPDGIGKIVGLPYTIVGRDRVNVHFGMRMVQTKNSIDVGGQSKNRNHGIYALQEVGYAPIKAPAGTEPEFTMPGGVIPILSKLEDISEEDMKQCFVIHGGKLSDYVDGEGGQKYFIVRYKHLGRLLSFRYELRNLNVNVTHYLLSKGYDLFSLIESGLAIDRKTLQS